MCDAFFSPPYGELGSCAVHTSPESPSLGLGSSEAPGEMLPEDMDEGEGGPMSRRGEACGIHGCCELGDDRGWPSGTFFTGTFDGAFC